MYVQKGEYKHLKGLLDSWDKLQQGPSILRFEIAAFNEIEPEVQMWNILNRWSTNCKLYIRHDAGSNFRVGLVYVGM